MDKFEKWWDEVYRLAPGARISDDFKSEYEVNYDDIIQQSVLTNSIPSADSCISLTDTSGYLLTTCNASENSWSITSSAYTPHNVCFYDSKHENSLTIDFDTGDVKLSAKMTIDEAAKLFWDRVMQMNPMADRKQLDDIEDRLVGKIDDYFQCVVMPEINDRIATKVEFLPEGRSLGPTGPTGMPGPIGITGGITGCPTGHMGAVGVPGYAGPEAGSSYALEKKAKAYDHAMKVVE